MVPPSFPLAVYSHGSLIMIDKGLLRLFPQLTLLFGNMAVSSCTELTDKKPEASGILRSKIKRLTSNNRPKNEHFKLKLVYFLKAFSILVDVYSHLEAIAYVCSFVLFFLSVIFKLFLDFIIVKANKIYVISWIYNAIFYVYHMFFKKKTHVRVLFNVTFVIADFILKAHRMLHPSSLARFRVVFKVARGRNGEAAACRENCRASTMGHVVPKKKKNRSCSVPQNNK